MPQIIMTIKIKFKMTYLFILGLFFLNTVVAGADQQPTAQEPTAQYQFFFLNPEVRWEKSERSEIIGRPASNFSISRIHNNSGFSLEYQSFLDPTGSGLSWIQRTHQELLLWTERYTDPIRGLEYYAGLGLGMFKEIISTRFAEETTVDESAGEYLAGAKTGLLLRSIIFNSEKKLIAIGFEFQAIFSRRLDPDPNLVVLVKAGFNY